MSDTPHVPAAIVDSAAWQLFQEGGLTTEFVSMQSDEAAALARELFGVTAAQPLTRFATEKDDTFRVDAADGRRYVLKIANPEEGVAEIDLQLQALQHIARAAPDLPVPRVYPDHHGEVLPEITDRAGQRRRVRLLSFLDGLPFDRVTSTTPAQRAQIGAVLARLRLALADFRHDAESRVLAWDVQHLMTLEPLLAGIADADANAGQRALLADALARYAEVVAPRIPHLRAQVLHNDFNQSNVVVAPDSAQFVSGVIDFGDIVRTAIAIDVSTALIGQLPRDTDLSPDADMFATGRDLLRGYLEVADLTDEELALIPHLTMGRVIARTLLTLWRARMFPDNATYILRNTAPGWAQLRWFLARSPEAVSAALSATLHA